MWKPLLQAGVFDPVDVHLGRWLGRLGEPHQVQLAGAVASHATRAGHVCADLRLRVGAIQSADGTLLTEQWPSWDGLAGSTVVGAPGEITPLILEGTRLYLQRYHQHESVLAVALRGRCEAVAEAVDEERLARSLARCFPASGAHDEQQRRACEVAVRRRLCVVSGGPGTGKTTTVARLLAVLADQRQAAGKGSRVRLLAPTGKAAARMVEALQREVQRLPEGMRAGLPESASTVHRALQPRRGSRTQFRRGPQNPLPDDVLVVDEASMVDLALMRRLVQAVRRDAHLVLLGDRDQLASVESGAVLGEIARGAELHPGSAVADSVVQLDHSFRFDNKGGIGGLAAAIRTGDADRALAELRDSQEVSLLPRGRANRLGQPLSDIVRAGFSSLTAATTPLEAVSALGVFRVLCAHRRGPWGVEVFNGLIERTLAEAGVLSPGPGWYPRRPVLVTANDYRLELFNGDQGVAMPGPRGLRAVFPGPTELRSLALSRLADVETVFALSVHKSQGSEFDRIVVVLPEVGSPLLSRELLYTAVTRAKQHVTVVADEAAVRAAIETPVVRVSGLLERLYE